MKKASKLGPARVRTQGQTYFRVTVRFRRRRSADRDRAVVQDALVRAHGFRTIAGLTGPLARALGRFRCYIGRSALAGLLRRLERLVGEGCISLWALGIEPGPGALSVEDAVNRLYVEGRNKLAHGEAPGLLEDPSELRAIGDDLLAKLFDVVTVELADYIRNKPSYLQAPKDHAIRALKARMEQRP